MKKKYFLAIGFAALSLVIIQRNFGSGLKPKPKTKLSLEQKKLQKLQKYINDTEKELAGIRSKNNLPELFSYYFQPDIKKKWFGKGEFALGGNALAPFNKLFSVDVKTSKEARKIVQTIIEGEESSFSGRMLKTTARLAGYSALAVAGFFGSKFLMKKITQKDDVKSIESSINKKAIVGAFTLPLVAGGVDFFTRNEKPIEKKAKSLKNKIEKVEKLNSIASKIEQILLNENLDSYPNEDYKRNRVFKRKVKKITKLDEEQRKNVEDKFLAKIKKKNDEFQKEKNEFKKQYKEDIEFAAEKTIEIEERLLEVARKEQNFKAKEERFKKMKKQYDTYIEKYEKKDEYIEEIKPLD
ncbi:hypothetical protein KAH94_02260 [bacterium]|nr:hypothetical protein [bacterium]